jgi:hypothetical protein
VKGFSYHKILGNDDTHAKYTAIVSSMSIARLAARHSLWMFEHCVAIPVAGKIGASIT